MELTASNALLAVENLTILRRNGFEVEEIDVEASGQCTRLQLTAQPVSKSTVFNMKGSSIPVVLLTLFDPSTL